MNHLIDTKNALWAEWLKSRGTRLLLTTFLLPVFVTIVLFLVYLYTASQPDPGQINPWPVLVSQTFNILCFVLLPMAIIMITSQSMQIEQKANAWKQLLTYPAPRWTILIGKYLFALGLIVAVFILIAPLLAINGWLLGWVQPQLGFHTQAFDWAALWNASTQTFLAAISIFAIQFVLAWLIPNYTLPIISGLFATIIFASVAQGWSKSVYVPYAYPMLRIFDSRGSLNVPHWGGQPIFLWYSIGYFLIVTAFVLHYSKYVKDRI